MELRWSALAASTIQSVSHANRSYMGYIIGYIVLAVIILYFVYDGMKGFDE
jgi:hypothetical protein